MSTWIGVGPATKAFEEKLKEITLADHVLSCSSGSSAILMAIHGLNLPQGSTILFPNYTFIAGANAAKFLGYNVKFIDIKEDTLCMDPVLAEDYIKTHKKDEMLVLFRCLSYTLRRLCCLKIIKISL